MNGYLSGKLVRVSEVAMMLGVSLSTVKRNAKIPYVMQGTQRYYNLEAVREALAIPEQPEAKTYAANGIEMFYCSWLGEYFTLKGDAIEDFIADWGTKEQVELLKEKRKGCVTGIRGFTEAQLAERIQARLTELEDETDNLYANEI